MIKQLEVDLKMASDPSLEKIVKKVKELIDEENATIASIQATNMRITKMQKEFKEYKQAMQNSG